MVLTFGLGVRLKAEAEFTLLVPSDDAIGLLPLRDWRDISSKASTVIFDRWYHHHHAGKKFDAATLIQAGNIQMDDLEVLKAVSAQNVTTIQKVDGTGAVVKQADVTKADLPWSNGIIHIIGGEI